MKMKKENIKKQKEVFIAQVEFAKKVNKPLIVHIREASNDSRQILIDYNAKEVGEYCTVLMQVNIYFL